MRQKSLPILLSVLVIMLTSCQTGKELYNIGDYERIDLPEGLFAKNIDKRKLAAREVSYYFQAGKDKMTSNPSLMMKQMAYFEFLANDLKRGHDIPAYKLRKLLDSRDELRKVIAIPIDVSASDAIGQLYSMSKLMAVAKSKQKDGQVSENTLKNTLVATKFKVDKLINQLIALKEETAE